MNATQYLATDGSSGIARFEFAAPFKKLGAAQLAHRIAAPPVLITVVGKQRACVLDASDTLTLFDPERLRELEPQKLEDLAMRRWTMSGKVTAGPFVRDGKIGCVVAKNRLVWLDPEKDEVAWEYRFADIVGEPNVIDGDLVVADVAGRFVALDPAKGSPRGPILTLKANVSATAAPLRYGPGRAFVPLTDGTILLLPLEKLRTAN